MNSNSICSIFLVVVAFGIAPFSRADTIRDYDFNGTIAPGTIDSQGAFGAAGANLGGDSFSINLYFDENIGLKVDNSGGYTYSGGPGVVNPDTGTPTPSPLLTSSYTINGETVAGSDGGFAAVTTIPDASFSVTGGGVSFESQLTGTTAFPLGDSPGVYDLSCTSMCQFIFTYSIDASVSGINLGPTLDNLVISDKVAPVPEPAPVWLLLSALVGLFFVAKVRRFDFKSKLAQGRVI
jgi:hypothetical protein